MRSLRWAVLPALCLVLAGAAPGRAEVTVELKGVHLCCPACAKAVAAILKDVEGVKGMCDVKKRTVTITAADEKAAQKALDALAAGGFHGECNKDGLKIKDDSGVAPGKVKSLTLVGIHNCCGQCCKGIKEALKKVEGVTGDTAKPKVDTFEVTGDFDAAAVVKALNDAGFHAKVKK